MQIGTPFRGIGTGDWAGPLLAAAEQRQMDGTMRAAWFWVVRGVHPHDAQAPTL
jgi:hypothetical protein